MEISKVGYILGLYCNNGKENGSYYKRYLLGLYWDNRKWKLV